MQEQLAQATATLAAAGVASPLFDAQSIAAHVLGCTRMELYFLADAQLPPAFAQMVQRRAQREPLQHILGTAPFGPLDLEVGPGVFIPRPETEVLADWAVGALNKFQQSPSAEPQPLKVVDLCAGSGALAAYVAHAVPEAEVMAVEYSPDALPYLQRNVAQFENVRAVIAGDVCQRDELATTALADWAGAVDLMVTNPPYVPERHVDEIDPETAADPHDAVFSGADGMGVITHMMDTLGWLLRPGGLVGIEHDESTQQQVIATMERSGLFTAIEPLADLTGRPRFVLARRVEC